MRRRVEELDDLVTGWMVREAFAPGVLDEVFRNLREMHGKKGKGDSADARRAELSRARSAADRERASLADAIARAPDLHDELVPRLREARERAARLSAELDAMGAIGATDAKGNDLARLGWPEIERMARVEWSRLAELLADESPTGRRVAMAALLDGGRWRVGMVTVGGRRCFELRGVAHLPPRDLLVSPAGDSQTPRAIPRIAFPVVLRPAA